MRTEKSTPAAAAVARFRPRVVRAWRGLASRGSAWRWALAVGGLGGLVLLGYLSAPTPAGSEFLRNGQKFPEGDRIKIARALDAQHIDYRVDPEGRVEIPADRLGDAKAALAKVAIGRHSFEEIREEGGKSSVFDDPADRERRLLKAQEDILAAMIANLGDGIASAFVTVKRPRSWYGPIARPAPAARPTAFVYLETERGRQIRHTTVQSIQNIIVGSESYLKPEDVTVIDQTGHHYLVAGDPNSSTISRTRAREEDLDRAILDEIDWVKGVRVTVQLVPAPTPASHSPAAATPPAPAISAVPDRPDATSVGVNTPLELDPDPAPGPDPAPSPPPAPIIAVAATEPSGVRGERARILVRVPRSYYLAKAPERDPSPDRLREIAVRTESLIREAVAHVVPPDLSGPGEPPDLKIQMIPDDDPAAAPLRSQGSGEPRRALPWWLPAGAAGGGVALAGSALAAWLLAGRRPAGRQRLILASGSRTLRRDPAPPSASAVAVAVGSEPGPGPAERVRELIRLNPEAAASVLHRWIGQGEPLR
jgi:flagellar M-ring protein FliF